MLGYAECPTQLCASGTRIRVGEFANRISRNTSNFAADFESPWFDRLCICFEIGRAALDEFFVC